jgi:drug/metabolite transporter (DMT)-like permease
MRLALLTFFVLIAFAGNSVLARLALSGEDIGPWGFSLLRFVSGAFVLLCLSRPKTSWAAGSWAGAFALCGYGVFFSFAYLELATGTGALLLFASVQITMLAVAFSRGERLSAFQYLGLGLASGGLIYLLAPGIEAPSLTGATLMILSGMGWGIYSILGKGAGQALARTTGNFSRAAILLGLMTPLILWGLPEAKPGGVGISLAILSGTVTSALGYALWYSVLKDLTVTTASISQLSVPVIAAIGGALFVFEPVTLPFAISCAVVLLGVGLATIKRPSRSDDPFHPDDQGSG